MVGAGVGKFVGALVQVADGLEELDPDLFNLTVLSLVIDRRVIT